MMHNSAAFLLTLPDTFPIMPLPQHRGTLTQGAEMTEIEKKLAQLGAGWVYTGEYFRYDCTDGMHLRIIRAEKIWIAGRYYAEGNAQSATWFSSWKKTVIHLQECNA